MRRRRPVVLDAGALIALERADPRMTELLVAARGGAIRLLVPDAVIAQVWRTGSGRQSRLAAMIGLKPDYCTTMPLDTAAARRIGAHIRNSGHSDVVDVHVAIVALDHNALIMTSDRDDLEAVDPALADRIIDV